MIIGSPLLEKKKRCCNCDFKEETNKESARKDSGFYLDGIKCEGFRETCGREFVEDESLAVIPGNGWVVGKRKPAWWCNSCHFVLCNDCHKNYLLEIDNSGGSRMKRRRLGM